MKINKIRRRRGAGERAEEAERLVWGANWEIQEKPPHQKPGRQGIISAALQHLQGKKKHLAPLRPLQYRKTLVVSPAASSVSSCISSAV